MKCDLLYLKAVQDSKRNKREVKNKENLKGIENTGERSQPSHNCDSTEVLFALRWQVKEELETLESLSCWLFLTAW